MSSLACNQVCDVDSGISTGFQPGADTIQLFSDAGAVTSVLSYATAEYIESNFGDPETDKPGWYDYLAVAQGDFSKPMGDISVKFGEGYVIMAGDGGGTLPTVTCSGAVKDGVTEIPGKPFAFAGNCTPSGITLADITCNQVCDVDSGNSTGFQPGADTLQFFSTEGKVSEVYSYATAEYIESNFGSSWIFVETGQAQTRHFGLRRRSAVHHKTSRKRLRRR